MDNKYNGWANYETWLTNLWLESNCSGLFSDLLNAALSRVDWYEIADAWLSDLVEEVRTK